ncbi:MAG TPA: DUF4288 domain-containing protein [Candidatus Limnocylindria bacterium]|nr:DUF4288 domain-containing protein [Candidatus Limnocylindria bacterium]
MMPPVPGGSPDRVPDLEAPVVPSGWYAIQLRYAYLVDEGDPALVEDRVILVDAEDEEAALGRAVELAPEYEAEFSTEDGRDGAIRFEGIVALKELDERPAAGVEVWHEFMSPDPQQPATDEDGEPLPPVWPPEMAFPRAHDG